jgi:hypothetical protein
MKWCKIRGFIYSSGGAIPSTVRAWSDTWFHLTPGCFQVEFDTPDRTYRSNPLCLAFICSEGIMNEQATCPDCSTVTCRLCKAASHRGDCLADTVLQQVLQTADENRWQRCYSCCRLVELDIGCNHITFVSSPYSLDSEVLLSYLAAL